MNGLDAFRILAETRRRKPLVHILMNMVAANNAANAVLQVGGSPVMAESMDEAVQIAESADALVLNAGMLSPERIQSMKAAGTCANRRGIPVVLDPVGVGASSFRQNAISGILDKIQIQVIKGNASEIACLCGLDAPMRGVDVELTAPDPALLAEICARKFYAVTAVTGPVDAVSDGNRTTIIRNGHYYMSCMTGFGCMAGALVGAFCGTESDLLSSTTAALVCMGVAGQKAADVSSGPGSFLIHFYDYLYTLGKSDLERFADILEL